jgi:endonuclease/exonuclease/phosphatase family metal-dependent hydrolase
MLLWICCAFIALWMALRHVPARWDAYRPLPELIALVPLLWIPTIIVLVVCLIETSPAQSLTALVLLGVQLLWHSAMYVDLPQPLLRLCNLPTRRRRASAQSAETNTQIHVMTLNCRFGRADAQSILNAVRAHHVDVLALQEVTPALLHALESHSIGEELPVTITGASRDDDNGGSNALLVRSGPVASAESSIALPAAAIPTATLDFGESSIRFASAHPKSPGRGGHFWHQGIQALGELGGAPENWQSPSTRAETTAERTQRVSDDIENAAAVKTVVLGDLNSSLYHPVFRLLLHTSSFSDASYELRKGSRSTFPSSWMFIPALIELDHVLLTPGLCPTDLTTLTIPGTDHRAVIATIVSCE